MKRIPDHIRWPGMVIAILGLSLSANVVLIFSANSDGGAQVEPEYYSRAVRWDKDTDALQKSRALGWNVSIQVDPPAQGGDVLRARVTDRDGQPLTGLEGSVKARHAALSREEVVVWVEDPAKRGEYTAQVQLFRLGLWDFFVHFDQKSTQKSFSKTMRLDIGGPS